MEITMANNSRMGHLSMLPEKIRTIALLLVFAPLALPFVPGEVHAREQALDDEHAPAQAGNLENVPAWIKDRFSESEIQALSPEEFRVETHFCSCEDKPDPHFPYAVVLFTTPKGDLVARAEVQEFSTKITPLAVRNGNQYCNLESEEPCYGSFASICEFTDFRFGPLLQEFFPTCK
jgi:hypothetical protein